MMNGNAYNIFGKSISATEQDLKRQDYVSQYCWDAFVARHNNQWLKYELPAIPQGTLNWNMYRKIYGRKSQNEYSKYDTLQLKISFENPYSVWEWF